jgi:hypothetical protein
LGKKYSHNSLSGARLKIGVNKTAQPVVIKTVATLFQPPIVFKARPNI